MQFKFLRRKPKPRTVIKDPKKAVKASSPVVGGRQTPVAQTKLQVILSRFRRQPETQKARDFGLDVRRQRNRQHKLERLSKVATPLLTRFRVGFQITTIAAVVALILLVGIVLVLHNNQVYVVRDIVVAGNKQILTKAILDELIDLKGKSMFTFGEGTVETRLQAKFPYIKTAQVRKQLPGRVGIEIEERYPAIAYVNLSGVFLVDEERVVVSQLGLKESTALTTDEMIVISGFGDPNAKYTYEHYLSKLKDEEERKQVKWDEITLGEKKQALQEYRGSLLIRVDTTLNNNLTGLLGTEFTTIPRVFGYNSQVYEIGGSFSEYKYTYSDAIQKYLNSQSLPANRLTWQSDFTLTVDLVNGIRLMFSSTRPVRSQLEALDTIRSQGNLSGATLVDLRSEIVAVR